MSYSNNFTFTIDNESIGSFYFSYNQNTNFYELLEYISRYKPEKNICSCDNLQYLNTSNDTYVNLSKNDKVYNFRNNQGFDQYKIITNKEHYHCLFYQNKEIHNIFKLSKYQIFYAFTQWMNNLKNKSSELKFNEDNEIECLKQFDINEYKFEQNSILFFSDKPEEVQNEEKNIINNFINNLNQEVNRIIQQLNTKITNLKKRLMI